MKILLCSFAVGFLLFGCATKRTEPSASQIRADALRNCYGTYAAPPRLENRRVHQDRLLSELREIRANTYHWLIWQEHDWDDLRIFLPRARSEKIKVWVTIVPPSESPPHTSRYSEPFQLDYIRWAGEIAKLSLAHTNLVAWSIDDFTHNLKFFTPQYAEQMLGAAREINPKLAFAPCGYYRSLTPDFAAKYSALIDGILFPYRAESAGANLQDSSLVKREVDRLRVLFGPNKPVILDVYATAHSRLGASTPEYVEKVLLAGKQSCDSVFIYCHQDPKVQPEKFAVLKRSLGPTNR